MAQDLVDLLIIVDDHVVVNIGLGGGEGELNHCDFGIDQLGDTLVASGVAFGKHQSFYELDVLQSAAHLLHNFNIVEVDIFVLLEIRHLLHGFDSYRRQIVAVLTQDFAL